MEPIDKRREDGFTLIELMVVVLIIGILIAIALPTYIGARKRAEDRAAQSNLRTGLAAAMTVWAQEGKYDLFNVASAEASEPTLDWQPQNVAPTGDQITIQDALDQALLLVVKSGSGEYFCLRQLANSPAFDKGHGNAFATVDQTNECTGGWG